MEHTVLDSMHLLCDPGQIRMGGQGTGWMKYMVTDSNRHKTVKVNAVNLLFTGFGMAVTTHSDANSTPRMSNKVMINSMSPHSSSSLG